MEFNFSPEEEAFRQELRGFLKRELPEGWVGPTDEDGDEHWELTLRMHKKLADKGWLTMAWPEARCSGARGTRSPSRARTLRRSRPGPSKTATTS